MDAHPTYIFVKKFYSQYKFNKQIRWIHIPAEYWLVLTQQLKA
jgi:hypothetical protein